jgi:hypothetical protein
MKLNIQLAAEKTQDAAAFAAGPMQPTMLPDAPVSFIIPDGFRRLKQHEVVSRGDYVASVHQGVESWEGPRGFRAGSFLKPIYRRYESRSTTTKKKE